MSGTAVASRASPVVHERARAFVAPWDDASVRMRLDTWENSVEEIKEHPLGTGVGTVGRASQHRRRRNGYDRYSYLKIFREQGVLGGVPFTLGVLALVARSEGLYGGRRATAGRSPLPLCGFSLVPRPRGGR